MKSVVRLALIAALFVLSGTGQPAHAKAPPADTPARLIVEDQAGLFSPGAVENARVTISKSRGAQGREVHVETYARLSEADQKRLAEAGENDEARNRFWNDWARGKVTGDRGVVVLINREPGHVHVLASRSMSEGFTASHQQEVKRLLLEKFRAASRLAKEGKPAAEQQTLWDAGLTSAMEYTAQHLPKTLNRGVLHPAETQEPKGPQEAVGAPEVGGFNIGSLLCIGISLMLGIWLVTALVRAFSGGGSGGGRGGMGGFFPSLLGGLFGAAAGMWMYDHFFGGSSSSAFGGESGSPGSDATQDGGQFDDPGTGGDFGGDWGGGDFGGGDF